MYSGTAFTIEVLIAALWGFPVCGFIGLIIAYPVVALTNFVIAPIVFSMIGYVLAAMAIYHMGTHMSFMPEHDIRGFSPDLVFSTGVIFWGSSTLLQTFLYTFLFTYGRMARPPRPPQKDPESDINIAGEASLPNEPTPAEGTHNGNQATHPNRRRGWQPDQHRRSGWLLRALDHQSSGSSSESSWQEASQGDPLVSPRQRHMSLSDSSIYHGPEPRLHVPNRPQSIPAGYPVPIIHCVPSFENSESSFNPNMGLLRPISTGCQSTTTVSSNMSERTSLMATGENDMHSWHRVSSLYSYDPRLTANLNTNRASVVTFVPAPGQLNMHPTRSYEMAVKEDSSNPNGMALKIIPEQFRRRHDIPSNDAQSLSNYHPLSPHLILSPFSAVNQQGQQRVPERRVAREIAGQHMALNNFKFGGGFAAPVTPTAHCQHFEMQHLQETFERNIDMKLPHGKVATPAVPYAPVAGPSKPRAPPQQTPRFHDDDDAMIPAFVYGGKPAETLTRESDLEMLNFMC